MPKSKRELHHFLDEELRLRQWPARRAVREAALDYLASKFNDDQQYTEAAVNALLRRWHLFDDPALLRRELYERGDLRRTRDGRAYWRGSRQ
jgi:hypothetical protein